MNICLISPTYHPSIGGTEEFVFNLGEKLTLAGYSVVVVTPEPYGKPPLPDHEKIARVSRFPYMNKPGLVTLTQNMNCYNKVASVNRDVKFDILHQFHVVQLGMASLFSKRRLRKPLISTLMGWDTFSPAESADLFYRLTRRFASHVLNSSSAVTSPSSDLAMRAYSNGCHQRIELIPHAVDRFDSSDLQARVLRLRKGLGIGNDRIVLTACRLTQSKNLETLVAASSAIVQQYRGVKFVIVGGGPDYSQLLTLVREKNIATYFRFVGSIPPSDMPIYYASSDIFVSTSLYEAFGMAVVEAMAAGRPVIAAKVGAIPEIIEDHVNGLLFPPRDSESLSELILYLLKHDDLRTRIGSSARGKVMKRYTWENIVGRYTSIYKSLC